MEGMTVLHYDSQAQNDNDTQNNMSFTHKITEYETCADNYIIL